VSRCWRLDGSFGAGALSERPRSKPIAGRVCISPDAVTQSPGRANLHRCICSAAGPWAGISARIATHDTWRRDDAGAVMLSPRCQIVYPLRQRSRDRRGTVPKGTNSVRNYLSVVLWFALILLPVPVFAQTNATIVTNTSSSSLGATNAVFHVVTTRIGPATIFIGARGLCTFATPPVPSCAPTSGTGTVADPFIYGCLYTVPITNCALDTPFVLAAGQVDIDTYVHTQTVGAAGSVAAPIPLDPWVPIGSALGVALLAIGWQLRRRRS
jgi:hypothetical protein